MLLFNSIADIDECVNRPCDQTCSNTFGSFVCSCRPGFQKVDNNPTSKQCNSKYVYLLAMSLLLLSF